MKKIKEHLQTFLEARNGVDQFAVFLMWLTIICLLGGALLRFPVLSLLGCLLLLYLYFRIFSGKKERRHQENMSFLGIWEHLRFRLQVRRLERSLKKTSRYVRCGACGKKYRVSREKEQIQRRHPGKKKVEHGRTEGIARCPFCGSESRKKQEF